MEIKNTQQLKKHNRSLILNEIIENGPLSRKELTESLDISQGAVSYLVKDLLEQRMIKETKSQKSTGGRPPRKLDFLGERRVVIAVELQAFSIVYKIYNLNFETLKERNIDILTNSSVSNLSSEEIWEYFDLLQEKIDTDLQVIGIDDESIIGVGVSVPGIYDYNTGRLTDTLDTVWQNRDIGSFFMGIGKKYSCSVFIKNDANLAAYFECHYGVGQDFSNLIYLFISEGIGSGIIIDNGVYEGAHGNAGELGHIKVSEDGKRCSCGGWGCLETVASGKALRQEVNLRVNASQTESVLSRLHDPPYQLQDIIAAYKNYDSLCHKVVGKAVNSIIIALSGVVSFFDPALLIVGDTFNLFDERLVNEMESRIKKMCYPNIGKNLRVKKKTSRANFQLQAVAYYVFDTWKLNV